MSTLPRRAPTHRNPLGRNAVVWFPGLRFVGNASVEEAIEAVLVEPVPGAWELGPVFWQYAGRCRQLIVYAVRKVHLLRSCKKPGMVTADLDSEDVPPADFDHPAECPHLHEPHKPQACNRVVNISESGTCVDPLLDRARLAKRTWMTHFVSVQPAGPSQIF